MNEYTGINAIDGYPESSIYCPEYSGYFMPEPGLAEGICPICGIDHKEDAEFWAIVSQ